MRRLFALCLIFVVPILPVASYAVSFHYEVTGVFDSDSGPLEEEPFSAIFTYSSTGDAIEQQSPADLTIPVDLAFTDPNAVLTARDGFILQVFIGGPTEAIELQIDLIFSQDITLNQRLPLPALFHGDVLLFAQREQLGVAHLNYPFVVRELTPIPEPSPTLLLSSGVGILLLSRYLRRRRQTDTVSS